MAKIKNFICFSLKSSMIGFSDDVLMEKQYQSLYKPLGKFLYSHQNFRLSISFNGVQLVFLEKKHPEFVELLKELIDRKQIETIGGGFYDPVFPLLYPMDRSGQIDLLSSKIRHLFGKRPRGISICASIWDPSLVSTFDSSGLEYVILDESLIPEDKKKAIPLLMSDKGKSLSIIYDSCSLKPENGENPVSYLNRLSSKIEKKEKNLKNECLESEKIISIQFKTNEFETLLASGFFEELAKEVSSRASNLEVQYSKNELFELCTCYQFVKNTEARIPTYISSGMSPEVASWAVSPYKASSKSIQNGRTIFDLFQIYPQIKALSDRMIYVSQMVNQSHGDKIRKIHAREKLWEAQIGDGFICTSKGAFVSSSFRQKAYKNLSEAEKIIRECGEFSETVSNFDYNGDGYDEYVCSMKNCFSVINRRGGAIREFDVLQNAGNYADNLGRIKEFEGIDDFYDRGLFVDHLLTEEEFSSYIANSSNVSEIFSQKLYMPLKANANHNEIILGSTALFNDKQQVKLKKKYIANSNGFSIQYILKNESSEHLKAKFVVESSFAQVNFNPTNFNAFKLEIISDDRKNEIDTKSSSAQVNKEGFINDVEAFQLTDTDNGISFIFEPNEACGLSFVPIVFKRPEYLTGQSVDAGMTFAASMFWNIDLDCGMEIEKNINFSFYPEHKKRKNSKNQN